MCCRLFSSISGLHTRDASSTACTPAVTTGNACRHCQIHPHNFESESLSVVSDSLRPHGLLQAMEFSRPEYWSWWPFPSPRDLPNPGIELRSPALQADSLPAEPQGKPKNTGVGSLSHLQQIFPTQGSNSGLLYCRRILYQPRYLYLY